MRVAVLQTLLLAPLSARAIRIVLSNDDGWAEKNIRLFYNALTSAGENVVISAPAENKSGSGSFEFTPLPVGSGGCQFDSCPAGSPAIGSNSTEPRFNYVNAFPVNAMRYGIQTLSGRVLGGPAELAVAGPNVGANAGVVAFISGTVGAATEASKLGVPGIAFSGTSGEQVAWNTPTEPYQQIYAELSTTVTKALVESGAPYLPKDIWLNVNFAAVEGACNSASAFKFILTRMFTLTGLFTKDVEHCGTTELPTESDVLGDGCYATISVSNANTKLDVDAATQGIVRDKLESILSCLP